ncbi:hypothetical protein V3W47_01560 [Deinococcus sp. YIM 134068]|uniref:hypothetical protein n=1 Tax=Deinococcus lichenicola TaxID=3118910 RepID=UPI002F938A99
MYKRNWLSGQGRWSALVIALGTLGTPADASSFALDGLLAINDAPSPCRGVRVQVFEGGRLSTEAVVLPSGEVKATSKGNKTLPRFVKGRAYNLHATCVSESGTFQNSELNFKAEGRTVMVVFTKTGFQFKRGGVAY